MELVDMLGLEPSALRCAGSSPVPGTINLLFMVIGLYNHINLRYYILRFGNSLIGRASDSGSEG